MKLKVEVITNENSKIKITKSLLQLLSKYEETLPESIQHINKSNK